MKPTLILFTLLFTANLFGQNFKIEWGTEFPQKQALKNIFLVNGKSFYGYNYGGTNFEAMIEVDNLNVVNQTNYTCSVNGEKKQYNKKVLEFNGKIYIFSSILNNDKTKRTLYYHEFKASPTKVDFPGQELISFDFDKSQKNNTEFKLIVSENKKRFCVIYEVEADKNKENGLCGYFIFDEDLKQLETGEFKNVLEKNSDVSETIESYFLANTGAVFIITNRYQKKHQTLRKVYHLKNKDFSLLDLGLKSDQYASEILIAENQSNEVMISGFWGNSYVKGESKGTGARGVFYCALNPQSDEILNSGLNEFSDEFIFQGGSTKSIEKAKRKNEINEVDASLNGYIMREFKALDDGGFLGLAERYWVDESTNTFEGKTTTTYKYYYTTLIAFKLDAKGQLVWQKKIYKYQVSYDYQGIFSSFIGVLSDGKYCMLFNDNKESYDPITGNYDGSVYLSNPRYKGGKYNAVALVEIDLETGSVDRKSIFGKSGLGMYFSAKQSRVDEKSNSIILNALKKKKRKLGRIQF